MARTRDFRARYRAEYVPTGYRGRRQLALTVLACTVGATGCLLAVTAPAPGEFLAVPLTFLYANLVEYWGHRGPMHHPVPGLGLLFRRHAGQHHRFFTAEDMALETERDFRAVLFPPAMLAFFGVLAVPLWLLLHWAWSANAAWLAVATALAYYLNYELLHFAYHCPADSRLWRIPGLARLQRLHRLHHDPRRMARCNFNITYPIGDLLFGTLARTGDPRGGDAGRAQSQKARARALASRSESSSREASEIR